MYEPMCAGGCSLYEKYDHQKTTIIMAKKSTSRPARKSNTKSAKKRATRSSSVEAKKTAGTRAASKRSTRSSTATKAKKVAKRSPVKSGRAVVKKAAKPTISKRTGTVPVKKRTAAKKSAARVAVKRAKPQAKALQKPIATRHAVRKKVVRRTPRVVVPNTEHWPQALNGAVEVKLDPQAEAVDAQRRSFRERLLAEEAQVDHAPNELHRGRTGSNGPSNDRPGSQPERKRHQYPNGNRPNSGSARSAAGKGRRRDNMSQGG